MRSATRLEAEAVLRHQIDRLADMGTHHPGKAGLVRAGEQPGTTVDLAHCDLQSFGAVVKLMCNFCS